MYLGALGAGIVLWLTYGVVSRDAALVATNVATSLAIGVLALLKYRFDRSSRRINDERVELLGSRRAA